MVSALLPWYAANARDLPWRREPYCRDPYLIAVSEIMLQQTQVKTVIPFWERWMRELPTIQAAVEVDSAKLHKLWEGLGYYTRVRNLQKAAQVIVAEHGGKFPENFDQVLALPGIGRYTAGAVCSIAFNQPTPILDGNVIRVLTRVFGIAENPKVKAMNARLWELAEELVSRAKEAKETKGKLTSPPSRSSHDPDSCSHLNQSLMEFGATLCTPRSPQCLTCPIQKLCVAFLTGRTAELPNLGKREAATARRFFAFVIEVSGKFLVQQRPAGVVNAHLWEFPNVEVGLRTGEPAVVLAELNLLPTNAAQAAPIKSLRTVKHSITRYRITLEAFTVCIKAPPAKIGNGWKTPGEMHALAFTSAHKKLLVAIKT